MSMAAGETGDDQRTRERRPPGDILREVLR
jgi:hypothetical protein